MPQRSAHSGSVLCDAKASWHCIARQGQAEPGKARAAHAASSRLVTVGLAMRKHHAGAWQGVARCASERLGLHTQRQADWRQSVWRCESIKVCQGMVWLGRAQPGRARKGKGCESSGSAVGNSRFPGAVAPRQSTARRCVARQGFAWQGLPMVAGRLFLRAAFPVRSALTAADGFRKPKRSTQGAPWRAASGQGAKGERP